MKGQEINLLWLLIPVIAIIALLVLNPVVIVNAGERGVVKTFGAVTDTFGEGLHFRTPIMQDVIMMDVRTQKYEVDASAATADLLDVATKVAVNYHLDSAQVAVQYQHTGRNDMIESTLIAPVVQEVVKASTANFNAGQLITQRSIVKEKIDNALRDKLSARGIIIETTSITDFKFPDSFNDAITAAQTSTQQAEKAKNDLVRIEVEAQQKVAQASGEANATVLKATAEAQALSIQGQAIRANPEVIRLREIDKWDGKYPIYYFAGSSSGIGTLLNLPSQ